MALTFYPKKGRSIENGLNRGYNKWNISRVLLNYWKRCERGPKAISFKVIGPRVFVVLIEYLFGLNFGGQNCRKSDWLPKILSAEIFCQQKFKTCQINIISYEKLFSCFNKKLKVYDEIRNRWKIFVGKNSRNFELVLKILSAEILSDKVGVGPRIIRLRKCEEG